MTTTKVSCGKVERKYKPREFLGRLHRETYPSISFKTFIYHLRHQMAIENEYITSAVDYETMIMDLVDFEYLEPEVLYAIDFKEDN